MKTKSKFDLNEMQRKFDKILDSFSDEDLVEWFELDEEEQLENLLKGKTITLSSCKRCGGSFAEEIEHTIGNDHSPLAA
ncbi:hypothetical protein RCC89_02980 [Cytophagaceae bacterium ABcell3]|nr:hypothetical protein RCC89_02980 [Cytophagaceae bacterium ABcell3]